jgi:hypothetical protein
MAPRGQGSPAVDKVHRTKSLNADREPIPSRLLGLSIQGDDSLAAKVGDEKFQSIIPW